MVNPPVSGSSAVVVPRDGWPHLVGAVVLMGAGWPVTKFAVMAGASALWVTTGRMALSCLVTGLAMLALRRLRLPMRADWPTVLALGLLQIAAYFALASAAVAWVPARRTAILSNATTLWIVPLSLLVLHEVIPPRRWLAAFLGLAGVAVMVGPWSVNWTSARALVGNVLLLGAALVWAVAIVVMRRWPPQRPVVELLPWCFGLATLAMLPLVATQPLGEWDGRAWSALVLLGAVMGPLGVWFTMQVQTRLPAVVSSVGLLLSPVVGIVLSTLWLGESLGLDLILGTVLILGGVAASLPKQKTARPQKA